MKTPMIVVLVVAAAGAGAGGGYWFAHRHGGAENKQAEAGEAGDKEQENVTAPVTVTRLRQATMSETVTAYGSVVAPPGEVTVASLPFESRVARIAVTAGQSVAAGAPLVQVQPSPATALALQEARSTLSAAQHDLQLIEQRFQQNLATNAELATAQNAARLAQVRLSSLEQSGAGEKNRSLTSNQPGIVSKIHVQVGQIVPAGGPLVEVAAQGQLLIKLGVEPSDAASLSPGKTVQISATDAAAAPAISAPVKTVARNVDPITRLVDVMVSLPSETHLLLDSFAKAQFVRTSGSGWVVPRSAVLPNDQGYTLFTVADGKAVAHTVQMAIDNGHDVLVISDELKSADLVVVVGNYELENGMKVQVRETSEPASMPSTSPPDDSHPPAAPATTPASAPSTGDKK